MNIPELLALNARKFPDQDALITPECRLDWASLHEQSLQLAAYLSTAYGINPKDRVALFMPNGYAWVLGYFAVLNLGAVVVPVNARLAPAELDYILQDCGASLVLGCAEQYQTLAPLLTDSCPGLNLDNPTDLLPNWTSRHALEPIKASTPCTLLYTSGTTGKPKGVLFNHTNLLTVANATAVEMDVRPDSRLLHMMPLTHSAPLHVFLLGGTYVGAAHIVLPEFTPTLLLDTVERERTTHFFGAPIAYLLTAQQPDIAQRDLSSMTCWVYGGGPLSGEQVDLIRQRMGTEQLYCVYGLTEAGPSGSLMKPAEHKTKAGSIGSRGALHTELRLIDDAGQPIAGEGTGQIQIRTAATMLGYWNKPEATADCLHTDGWLDSGDVARRDAEGYYWVLARKKELIISGGVNIYPREIESALEQHPAIAEVAVIGVPHTEWGETVKACVVLREPVENCDQTLRAYLKPLLADYKIPRLFSEHSALPRNANGKVMKHQL